MRIKYVRGVGKELEQDLPDDVARELISSGMAERVLEQEAKAIEEGAGGIDVDQFIKAAQDEAGAWIRAGEVQEGDTFTIHGRGTIDNETFDRPYIVLPVVYRDQERMLRIGVRSAERIRKVFGPNTTQWVGREIRVTAVEIVPGLSKQRGTEVRRMILDGVA